MPEGPEKAPDSSQQTGGNEKAQKLAEELKLIATHKEVAETPTGNFSLDLANAVALPGEQARLDGDRAEKVGSWASEERQQAAELDETEKPLHVAILDKIKQAGVTVKHEDEAMYFLAGADIIHSKDGRSELARLMGSDEFSAEDLQKFKELRIEDTLSELITERVKEELSKMLPLEKLTEPGNVSLNQELSSPVDIDPIEEIENIMSDPDFIAAQGMFQNVIISKDSNYVLKILKMGERNKEYAREDIRRTGMLKEVFGDELVAEQVAVDMKDPELTVVLQEKLDMESYQVLTEDSGASEILGMAQASPESAAVLQQFLDGMRRLESQTGGVLDMLGDNVYFRTNEAGVLEIKIIDPGCFFLDDGYEGAASNIKRVKDLVAKLEQSEAPSSNFNADVADYLQARLGASEAGQESMSKEENGDDLEVKNSEDHQETEEFLGWLQQKGVDVPEPDIARQALNDPNLFNQPLPPLLGKLGMTMEDARSIGMDLKKEVTKVTAARFKEYIATTDWKSRLSPENLGIVADSEDDPRSPESVALAVSQILESDNLEFAQGAVWAMASAPDSPWVAKFVKSGEGSSSPEWTMNEMLEQRSDVAEVFGEDLLLDQVALVLKDKKTPIILQEKVNLEEWEPMGAFNTDILDKMTQAIAGNPENKGILNDFLEKVKVLEDSKGLVLDFSGDNIVFSQDEQGRLLIKILDYGCTKLEGEDPQRLAHLHEHAVALRALTA